MMGYLNENRVTQDLDFQALDQFGSRFCTSLIDWFQMIELNKRERVVKAIKLSVQRKQKKRSILDILGSEDFEELKEEINSELKRV